MISWPWKPSTPQTPAPDLSTRVAVLEAQVLFLYNALLAAGVPAVLAQPFPIASTPPPPPMWPNPKVGTSVRKLRTDKDIQVLDRSRRLELQQERLHQQGHAPTPSPSTGPTSPPNAPLDDSRLTPAPSTTVSSGPASPRLDSPGIITPKG